MRRGDHCTELTREELYAQVWAEPMTKLAQRYGMSDRGLAKVCTRMGIPVPGRGYWARVQSGQVPLCARVSGSTQLTGCIFGSKIRGSFAGPG
jgi:hypothetical protein